MNENPDRVQLLRGDPEDDHRDVHAVRRRPHVVRLRPARHSHRLEQLPLHRSPVAGQRPDLLPRHADLVSQEKTRFPGEAWGTPFFWCDFVVRVFWSVASPAYYKDTADMSQLSLLCTVAEQGVWQDTGYTANRSVSGRTPKRRLFRCRRGRGTCHGPRFPTQASKLRYFATPSARLFNVHGGWSFTGWRWSKLHKVAAVKLGRLLRFISLPPFPRFLFPFNSPLSFVFNMLRSKDNQVFAWLFGTLL